MCQTEIFDASIKSVIAYNINRYILVMFLYRICKNNTAQKQYIA